MRCDRPHCVEFVSRTQLLSNRPPARWSLHPTEYRHRSRADQSPLRPQTRQSERNLVMSHETLTVTDNRTSKSYTLPIENGTVRAMDLRQIKTDEQDFGLMTYDPAFMNTASCRSSITYIDGDRGILRYRGYPIEVLAEHC